MSSEPSKDAGSRIDERSTGQSSIPVFADVNSSIERLNFDKPPHEKSEFALEFADHRSKVLYEKERKKREEQERIENELKQIRMQNYEARKIAADKKNALFRHSYGMVMPTSIDRKNYMDSKRVINTNSSKDSITEGESHLINNMSVDALDDRKREFMADNEVDYIPRRMKIQEDYEMGEEDERFAQDEKEELVIEEEEFEEEDSSEEQGKEVDINLIEARLTAYQEMRTQKTTKIIELKQSLKQTRQYKQRYNFPNLVLNAARMERTLMRQSQLVNMGGREPTNAVQIEGDFEENKDDEFLDFDLSDDDDDDDYEDSTAEYNHSNNEGVLISFFL